MFEIINPKETQTFPNGKVTFWAIICLYKLKFMKTIKVKEFEVPIGIIADVADILNPNNLTNKIKGTNVEHGFVFLEVNFDRDGEKSCSCMS